MNPVLNMKPVQFCIDFIFCTFSLIVTALCRFVIHKYSAIQ